MLSLLKLNGNEHVSRNIAHLGIGLFVLGAAIEVGPVLPVLCLIISSLILVLYSEVRNNFKGAKICIVSLVLFIFFFAISVLTSDNMQRSLFLSSPLVYGLILYLILVWFFKENDCYAVFFDLTLMAIIISASLLWTIHTTSSVDYNALVVSSKIPALITRNDLSLLSVITTISFSYVLYPSQKLIFTILGFLSIILSSNAIVMYESRGACLSLIIGCSTVVMLIRSKKSILLLLFVLSLLFITDATNGFHLFIRHEQALSGLDGSLSHRAQLWESAWAMFMSAPWLGHGPHTFGLHDHVPWAHNLYLEILAEQGLIGLSILIAILISSCFQLWKTNASIHFRILASGITGAIVCFASASLVELSFIRMWVVVIFFLITGLSTSLAITV